MNAVVEDIKSREQDYDFSELPVPLGWRMLILPYEPEQVTAGGIVIPSETQNAEKVLTCVGRVVAMGELCYTSPRFAVGDRDPKPWCQVGDFVVYYAYNGQKIRYQVNADGSNEDVELVILNDDEIKLNAPNAARVKAYV